MKKRYRNCTSHRRKKKQYVVVQRRPALWWVARILHVLGFQRIGIAIGRLAVRAEVIG